MQTFPRYFALCHSYQKSKPKGLLFCAKTKYLQNSKYNVETHDVYVFSLRRLRILCYTVKERGVDL